MILIFLVNLGAFISYWFIDIDIPMYNMWIPLHFLMLIAIIVYYFNERRDHKRVEAIIEIIKTDVKESLSKVSVASVVSTDKSLYRSRDSMTIREKTLTDKNSE